ncbi:hypothetical protein GJU40_05185 [Bacillus lacus]|uniref:YhcU family protein n=1 Tax=Metabacillus lacus TaxID=1983721 RepID=A0A7X2LZD2_9BACI|nr:DUF5365 family protein [Metabacillus lacus]MRX71569.1 hypothetical protein [Metabacillus lacus]
MKIIIASTEEQERYIEELVNTMYNKVFPMYFSEELIAKLEELSVLRPSGSDSYLNSTLDQAFKIMSSLQTLICVLEHSNSIEENEYKKMFEKNKQTLEEFGYSFPLKMEHFLEEAVSEEELHHYGKPANKWLI